MNEWCPAVQHRMSLSLSIFYFNRNRRPKRWKCINQILLPMNTWLIDVLL